jgi:hypothetical protein
MGFFKAMRKMIASPDAVQRFKAWMRFNADTCEEFPYFLWIDRIF